MSRANKYGIHCPNGRNPNFDLMMRMGCDCYTLLNVEDWLDVAREIRRRRPNAIILVRYYLPRWSEVDPVAWAEECARTYLAHKDVTRHCTWANEQNLAVEGGGATRGWYERINEWNKRFILRFRGLAPDAILHYPAFAYGHNDDQDDRGEGWTGYELCRESIAYADVLDHHPYWRPGGAGLWDDDAEWYAFRFAKAHAFFPDMPMFLSEVGNFSPTDHNFIDQILYYFGKLYEYPYVIGATPFIWADPTGHHAVNDWQRIPNLDRFVDRIAETPKPEVDVPTRPILGAEYPDAAWEPAHPNNYTERPPGVVIDAIVLHATGGPEGVPHEGIDLFRGTVNWFKNPNATVSAHYVVSKEGQVAQCVREAKRAHHAGVSEYLGRENWNDFSIGIEMANWNDGVDPYPEAQIRATAELCKYLVEKYNIPRKHLVTHAQISGPRKNDPLGFDLQRFLDRVYGPVGYDSHYVLMAQNVPASWRRALERYFDTFKVTNGQSHDDAMVVHGTRHHITLVGSPECPYGVPQEVEDFIRAHAPEIEIDRMMATTAEELRRVADERAATGRRFG
ncbi:MAG TPA: N-acetylmuramoyl-L-alanine amidase [Anaerolineae bacterium]|nr:N-acetylmuramoyl-L-alanine amidase [Anaerolineae bacterium]